MCISKLDAKASIFFVIMAQFPRNLIHCCQQNLTLNLSLKNIIFLLAVICRASVGLHRPPRLAHRRASGRWGICLKVEVCFSGHQTPRSSGSPRTNFGSIGHKVRKLRMCANVSLKICLEVFVLQRN